MSWFLVVWGDYMYLLARISGSWSGGKTKRGIRQICLGPSWPSNICTRVSVTFLLPCFGETVCFCGLVCGFLRVSSGGKRMLIIIKFKTKFLSYRLKTGWELIFFVALLCPLSLLLCSWYLAWDWNLKNGRSIVVKWLITLINWLKFTCLNNSITYLLTIGYVGTGLVTGTEIWILKNTNKKLLWTIFKEFSCLPW